MSKQKTLIKGMVNETALLNRYLKSRGINPQFVSKDQKVAHSKTNQFKTWMRDHINDRVVESIAQEKTPTQQRLSVLKKSIRVHREIRVPDGQKKLHSEAVDKKDTITFDIPLLIRVLEFAREDLKSDIDLHKMVERLLNIRGKGTLSMNEYQKIVKEEVEQLDEISKQTLHSYSAKAQEKYGTIKGIGPEQSRKRGNISTGLKRAGKRIQPQGYGSDIQKDYDAQRATGKKQMGDSVEVEGEPIQEVSSEMLGRYKEKAKQSADTLHAQGEYKKSANRWLNVMKATGKQISKLKKENLEPMAACNQPGDGANNPDDTAPPKRSSKLKLLLGGKKTVKEEIYDHEKEDKSVATYGKKPKFQKPGMDSVTKESPQAAAVLSGGKTMSGETRDTVEIDPMMKMKKQSPDSQKNV